MTKIALDGMGGDNAPAEIIQGLSEAIKNTDAGFYLIGDKTRMDPYLAKFDLDPGRVEIIHTDETIEMGESLTSAVESKPEASVMIAAKLVSENKADVLVSAGNTGGVVVAASKYIPMIQGVERSALATIYPSKDLNSDGPEFSFLLDAGATIHCNVKHLVHFAFMGHFYSKNILGISEPRIALLNIGSEETKGGHVLTSVYKILKDIPEVNFIGNIEGYDLLRGAADVIVCEGMIGNVAIKILEGIADSMHILGQKAYNSGLRNKLGMALLSNGLRELKKRLDYTEYGGAPVLGFQKLCIVAHGKSNARAICRAIEVAEASVKNGLCDHIRNSVTELNRKLSFADFDV
ncbi:MAG: phosphate acyltransferase PlsX [bacterium]|nr:phosphate acyltransferase PlsX [bacterium]